MKNNTFTTIFRSVLHSKQFQNEKCFKVWIWCLLKRTDNPYDQVVGRQTVHLEAGQFVFGRHTASQELNMAESTVWFWIKWLEDDGSLDIKVNNKFSVISVSKHKEYRELLDRLLDNRRTTDGHKQVREIREVSKNSAERTLKICEDVGIEPSKGLDLYLERHNQYAFQSSALMFKDDCAENNDTPTASKLQRWFEAGIKKGMVKRKEQL